MAKPIEITAYVEKDPAGNVIGLMLQDGKGTVVPLKKPAHLLKAVVGSDRILELFVQVDAVEEFEQTVIDVPREETTE